MDGLREPVENISEVMLMGLGITFKPKKERDGNSQGHPRKKPDNPRLVAKAEKPDNPVFNEIFWQRKSLNIKKIDPKEKKQVEQMYEQILKHSMTYIERQVVKQLEQSGKKNKPN